MAGRDTRALETRKLISAAIPVNISAEDKKLLEAEWDKKAKERNEAIERETRIPTEPSLILKYEIHKFGRHWMSYSVYGKKRVPLLNGPSLFTSAVDALNDKMSEEVSKA
jgi:hypothetical protein